MGAYFTSLDPKQQLRLGEQYMCHIDITVKTMEKVGPLGGVTLLLLLLCHYLCTTMNPDYMSPTNFNDA